MRGLVQLRNEMVHHLREDAMKKKRDDDGGDGQYDLPPLPAPESMRRACAQCPHLLTCSLHQVLSGQVPDKPHAMAELAPEATKHLTEAHLEFYKRWSVATTLEKQVGTLVFLRETEFSL